MQSKYWILGCFMTLSASTLAWTEESTQVAITSFSFVGNTHLAELCGKVSGKLSALAQVSVVVDPKTNGPGSYNTLADKKGSFCILVATQTGTAEVSLLQSGKEYQPTLATVRPAR